MSAPNVRFAKAAYWAAGIWGVLILTPPYFIFNVIGRQDPPAITHPLFLLRLRPRRSRLAGRIHDHRDLPGALPRLTQTNGGRRRSHRSSRARSRFGWHRCFESVMGEWA